MKAGRRSTVNVRLLYAHTDHNLWMMFFWVTASYINDIKCWLWCVYSMLHVLLCMRSHCISIYCIFFSLCTGAKYLLTSDFKIWFFTHTHIQDAHPTTDPKGTMSLGDRSFVELFIRHLLSASSWKRRGLFPRVAMPRTTGRRKETFHSATKVRWMTTLSYWDTREGERDSHGGNKNIHRCTFFLFLFTSIFF